MHFGSSLGIKLIVTICFPIDMPTILTLKKASSKILLAFIQKFLVLVSYALLEQNSCFTYSSIKPCLRSGNKKAGAVAPAN